MENPAEDRRLPAALTPRVLVRGHRNAGKTRAAIAHVAELAAAGEDPASVLFVAASPTAVADARRALVAADPVLAAVPAMTARDYELSLLDAPAARAITGRRPRVLADFEEQFLTEDLRTTSMPGKRIKGMLGFFQRSWTELADDDMGSFILDAQEHVLHTAVKRYLASYDALDPCEVSNLAVNYLRACPLEADGAPVHVVVDDYQSLNRASQVLLDLVPCKTLWAFADPIYAAEGSDPFPYLAGVERFAQEAGTVVVDLPDPEPVGAAGAAGVLASCGFMEAASIGVVENRGKEVVEEAYDVPSLPEPLPGVEALAFATPREEFAGVVGRVAALLEGGVSPEDVVVAVPNRTWASNVAKALGARGRAAQVLGRRQPVGGNVRELEACPTARMYTALALLADPEDALAWRCWCGFGDYLGRSNVYGFVMGRAADEGVSVSRELDALYRAGAASTKAQEAFFEAYRQGRGMIEALAGLRGAELVAELAAGLGLDGVPPVVARARDLARAERGGDADAAAIFCALQGLALEPALAGPEGGVRVVEFDRIAGVKGRHVLVAGLMNGWFPEHAYFDLAEADFEHRRRMDRECRAGLYALAGTACESLAFSGFEACDLELAERMKLKGYRVRMTPEGRRVTTVRRSDLLPYALDAWGIDPLAR